jgi:hypothetical protein
VRSATTESGDDGPPAKVEPIEGTDLSRVILTRHAAERIGLRTARVEVASVARPAALGGQGGPATAHEVIPYDAVLYDSDGATWTFTSPAPLRFVRRRIVVAWIDGDRAVLAAGPPAGTEVVTVGAAELLGAEIGVGE